MAERAGESSVHTQHGGLAVACGLRVAERAGDCGLIILSSNGAQFWLAPRVSCECPWALRGPGCDRYSGHPRVSGGLEEEEKRCMYVCM